MNFIMLHYEMLSIPIGKCRSGSAPKLEMELQNPIWSFGAPNPPKWSSGSSIWEDLQGKCYETYRSFIRCCGCRAEPSLSLGGPSADTHVGATTEYKGESCRVTVTTMLGLPRALRMCRVIWE